MINYKYYIWQTCSLLDLSADLGQLWHLMDKPSSEWTTSLDLSKPLFNCTQMNILYLSTINCKLYVFLYLTIDSSLHSVSLGHSLVCLCLLGLWNVFVLVSLFFCWPLIWKWTHFVEPIWSTLKSCLMDHSSVLISQWNQHIHIWIVLNKGLS